MMSYAEKMLSMWHGTAEEHAAYQANLRRAEAATVGKIEQLEFNINSQVKESEEHVLEQIESQTDELKASIEKGHATKKETTAYQVKIAELETENKALRAARALITARAVRAEACIHGLTTPMKPSLVSYGADTNTNAAASLPLADDESRLLLSDIAARVAAIAPAPTAITSSPSATGNGMRHLTVSPPTSNTRSPTSPARSSKNSERSPLGDITPGNNRRNPSDARGTVTPRPRKISLFDELKAKSAASVARRALARRVIVAEPTPEPTPEPSAEVVALTNSPAFRCLRKFNLEAEAESSDSDFVIDSPM